MLVNTSSTSKRDDWSVEVWSHGLRALARRGLAPALVVGLAASLVVGAAVLRAPVARDRVEAYAARTLKRWASTIAMTHHAGSTKTVLSYQHPGRSKNAVDDGRYVHEAASQVAGSLAPIDLVGLVGLAPDVAASGNSHSFSTLEHASLTDAPVSDAGLSPALRIDIASAHQAIALYRKGAVEAGDEFAKAINDPLLRTMLEWVALRYDPREAGVGRLTSFLHDHPDWPMAPWLRRRVEEISVSDLHAPDAVEAWFDGRAPQTFIGRLALARAALAQTDILQGAAIVRSVWRHADLTPIEEANLLREFGSLIGRDDHKYRADRLLYKEQVPAALRAAALAGPDVRLLALARASVINLSGTVLTDAAINAVPKTLAADPGLTFSRIQKARRSGDIKTAADLMVHAPAEPDVVIDGDEWWTERRLVARKLLDMGDPRTAYRICAEHAPASDAATIEAEFHAGWISLRFLDDAKTAAMHFAKAERFAETPISRARIAYWQGRAAEAGNDQKAADIYYASAAEQPISFYGQLAGSRIGKTAIDLRQPTAVIVGDDRRDAIRVVEQLYGLGERDIALPLAFEIAKTEPSDAQVAALGAVLTKANDARGTLLVGKYATQRGMALDETAFPIFGIPGYQPLANSADKSVVYAIARQESEFDSKSVSSAGAKGLMQLISSTARQTATKLGVGYDEGRLLNDAAFNAQIGAAHLGQLLAEQGGSYILTFAAYNAGSGRVKEWIDAYGDPRKPGIDPVDWIERIPFTETRNYVQRVFENMQVYRRRFGETTRLAVDADLAARGRGT